jgi:hypothetical protein
MRTLAVIACWWLLSAAGFVHAAGADEFPVKSIRIVVPFPAGGTTDILARSVAQALGQRHDVATFVENRAGASGTIGSQLVATSPADGSVLLLTATHHVINPSLFRKLPYDTRKAGRGDAGDSRIARHQANIRNPGSILDRRGRRRQRTGLARGLRRVSRRRVGLGRDSSAVVVIKEFVEDVSLWRLVRLCSFVLALFRIAGQLPESRGLQSFQVTFASRRLCQQMLGNFER